MRDTEERLEQLLQMALEMGATNARIIPADKVVVDPGLAEIVFQSVCPLFHFFSIPDGRGS